MSTNKIVLYKAAWHPVNNEGIVRIQLEGGESRKWTGKDPAEFVAILQILSGDNDPFFSDDGWIATGPESPGTW